MNEQLENMKQIDHYSYVVWTQAGFDKACNLVKEHDEYVEGYPRIYPAFVEFVWCEGIGYWQTECTALTKAIKETRELLESLIQADSEHLLKLAEKNSCWCNGSRNCNQPCHPDNQ